jgi:hypothetical protein
MTKPMIQLNASTIHPYALGFVLTCVLAACTSAPTIGSAPWEVPPKLVTNPVDKTVSWDNVSAFGPVPANLAPKGDATCGTINTKDAQYKAIGYHPKAIGLDGKPFPEGAYLCSLKWTQTFKVVIKTWTSYLLVVPVISAAILLSS